MRASFGLLLGLLLVSGCVGSEREPAAARREPRSAPGSDAAASVETASVPTPAPREPTSPAVSTSGPDHVVPVHPLRAGGLLAWEDACKSGCLESWWFRVEEDAPAMLEVRVAWDGVRSAGFKLEVRGPDKSVHAGERGFDSARVLLPRAGPGVYSASLEGEGDASLRIGLRAPGAPRGNGTDLLPNLVTLVPSPVRVADCDPWETVEQEAKKCLRLGNGIGNVGDGYLEVALAPAEGVGTLAGQGRFVQRLLQAEGAPREVPVGAAAFHPTHAHYHYDGVAAFALHPIDPATGLRGAAVATHHKAGFCLLDIGEMEEADAEPEEREEARAEQACLVPGATGWTMGISRGWYDYYGYGLTDQYVEISDVPDGLYELVSTCNYEGTLQELDLGDNAASVLLELRGGRVEVLEERGFYRVPEMGSPA